MEKILKIEETTFNKSNVEYDGYQVVTDLQTIQIGISNVQYCCESFGCIITNDDVSEFIGAELKSVAIVDNALNYKKIEKLGFIGYGSAMFINLETSEGLLQFVAYNAHNGYYGHDAVLISTQLTTEQLI